MSETDASLRNGTPTDLSNEASERMTEADEKHTQRLKEIVAQIGWPTRSKVGKEAAHAAWLLAQHATDKRFMEACLELMKHVLQSDVDKTNIAYLEDRVRVLQGRRQLYGTQYQTFSPSNGITHARIPPIEEPESLEERRMSVGLQPFSEFLCEIQKIFGDNLRLPTLQ